MGLDVNSSPSPTKGPSQHPLLKNNLFETATSIDLKHYQYLVSRDVIIMTIFFSVVILLAILAVILVGCQAVAFLTAAVCILAMVVVGSSLGILLVFVLNMGKSSYPRLHPIDETIFTKKDRRFLESVLNLPLQGKEEPPPSVPLRTEDVAQIHIETTFYREEGPFLEDVDARIKILEESISSLITEIFQAVSECQKSSGLIFGICNEIKNLFLPKFLSYGSKHSLCKCLNNLAEILIKHPCADFVILVLKNRDLMQELANQLISLAPTSDCDQAGVYRKTLDSLNLWFYGWFRETATLQRIENYDPSLLTADIRKYLNDGNFVELVFSFQTEEVKEKISKLFDLKTQGIIPAVERSKYLLGMNSIEYVRNSPRLRTFMDALNLHLAFCLNLRAPSDWMFSLSVARYYKDLIKLYDFAWEEYSTIAKNPFLLLEIFQDNIKYQIFVRGLLEKAMPIKRWTVLFRPMISAMFRVGIARKKELEVLAAHLGMEFESLKEAITSGQTLETLLPHLFSQKNLK